MLDMVVLPPPPQTLWAYQAHIWRTDMEFDLITAALLTVYAVVLVTVLAICFAAARSDAQYGER